MILKKMLEAINNMAGWNSCFLPLVTYLMLQQVIYACFNSQKLQSHLAALQLHKTAVYCPVFCAFLGFQI